MQGCDSIPEQNISDEKSLASLHLPYQNTSYDAVNPLLPQQSNSTDRPISISWTLSDEEKATYDRMFQAWDQFNTGFIQGSLAHQAFESSQLCMDDLNKIWGLVDVRGRGALNRAELYVTMGLIYRRMHGIPVPDQLPPELFQGLSAGISANVLIQSTFPELVGLNYFVEDFAAIQEGSLQAQETADGYSEAPETDWPSFRFESQVDKGEESIELARLDQEIRDLTEELDLQPSSSSYTLSPPPPVALNKPLPALPPADSSTPHILPRVSLDNLHILEGRIEALLKRLDETSSNASLSKGEGAVEDEGRRRSEQEAVCGLTKKIFETKKRIKAEERAHLSYLISRPVPPPHSRAPPTPSPSPPCQLPPAPAPPRKKRPPPPPPSRPPSIAVINLIEVIKAGKKLHPTKPVIKKETFPTGKVLGVGVVADALVTNFDADLDVGIAEPSSSGSCLPLLPTASSESPLRPDSPPTSDGSRLLNVIEAGKELRLKERVIKAGSLLSGKVDEGLDADLNSHQGTSCSYPPHTTPPPPLSTMPGFDSPPRRVGGTSGGSTQSNLLCAIKPVQELQPSVTVEDTAGQTEMDLNTDASLTSCPRICLSYPSEPLSAFSSSCQPVSSSKVSMRRVLTNASEEGTFLLTDQWSAGRDSCVLSLLENGDEDLDGEYVMV